jgi:hypothetical protein
MTPRERQLVEAAKLLCAATRAGRLRWEKTGDPDVFLFLSGGYQYRTWRRVSAGRRLAYSTRVGEMDPEISGEPLNQYLYGFYAANLSAHPRTLVDDDDASSGKAGKPFGQMTLFYTPPTWDGMLRQQHPRVSPSEEEAAETLYMLHQAAREQIEGNDPEMKDMLSYLAHLAGAEKKKP